MKINTEKLINNLTTQTKANISRVEVFKKLTMLELNYKKTQEKWSVLECIEHLNLYGDFYIPEIIKKVHGSNSNPNANFKSGLVGNYFVNSMIPKANMKKMKTFVDKNPTGSSLDSSVLDRFIEQQIEMLELFEKAKKINLTKVKTAITISKFIRLRLGDTFRFIVTHNDRHLTQAEQVKK